MKKKISRIILTIIIPFVFYFGLTAIGIFAKSQMPGDENVPNFLEGIGVTVVAVVGIALIGGVIWVCYWAAGLITDGISDRLRYRRIRRESTYDDWPNSPATTVPPPPVDEDQAYLQRIGVEEEDETESD